MSHMFFLKYWLFLSYLPLKALLSIIDEQEVAIKYHINLPPIVSTKKYLFPYSISLISVRKNRSKHVFSRQNSFFNYE